MIDESTIPGHVFDRIVNWARWAGGWACGYGSCASVEGRYQAVGGDTWDSDYQFRPLPIDIRDAELVEKAWTKQNLRDRNILRSHFIYGRSPGAIARAAGIRRSEYSGALYTAAMRLANSLASPLHLAA